MRVGSRWARLVVVAVLASSMSLACGAFGAVGAQDQGSEAALPSPRKIDAGIRALGKKASGAVLESVNRGYSVPQVANGLADHDVRRNGNIVSDGQVVTPANEPAAVITPDGAGGTASEGDVKHALSDGSIYEKLVKTPEARRRGRHDALVNNWDFTRLIILAAVNGYTPEQIILDGLLDPRGGFCIGFDCAGGVNTALAVPLIILNSEGPVIPEGTPVQAAQLGDAWLGSAKNASKTAAKPIDPNADVQYTGSGSMMTFINTNDPVHCSDPAAQVTVRVDRSGQLTGNVDGTAATLDATCEQQDGAIAFYASGPPPAECTKHGGTCRYKLNPKGFFKGELSFTSTKMTGDLQDTSSGFQQTTLSFSAARS
jgi:hypothetical protein